MKEDEREVNVKEGRLEMDNTGDKDKSKWDVSEVKANKGAWKRVKKDKCEVKVK